MRLHEGMLIRTNYSGPYRIVQTKRNCTCSYDQFDPETPTLPAHIHLILTHPRGGGKFYLGWFVEETLLSLQKTYCGFKVEPEFDRIIVMEQDTPVQMKMF